MTRDAPGAHLARARAPMSTPSEARSVAGFWKKREPKRRSAPRRWRGARSLRSRLLSDPVVPQAAGHHLIDHLRVLGRCWWRDLPRRREFHGASADLVVVGLRHRCALDVPAARVAIGRIRLPRVVREGG